MKKLLFLSFALVFAASTVFAVNFAPQLLKISAPTQVQYNFDGKNLSIPVTVTGTAAGVNFFVFTKGKAATISKIRNGFLGWHYVNKIDTCIYFSQQVQFIKGNNTLVWNGKDKNGILVPKGDYTYYLWGYDNVGAKTQATPLKIKPRGNWYNRPIMVQKGMDGKALANPIIWSRNQKWILGTDPADSLLIETCTLTLPAGYGQGMGVCLQPDNYTMMFLEVGLNAPEGSTTSQHGIAKYKWVPNGAGVLQTDWAKGGMSFTTAHWGGGNAEAGVVTDGNYLFTVTGIHYIPEAESDFRIWDLDGTILKKFDISDTWSSIEAKNKGGQANGGPNYISESNGHILLNCHCSCLVQVLNPAAGLVDEGELIMWTNQNGDHILDHNDDPLTAKVPWMCNDYNVGPYKYTFEADSKFFSMVPSYDMGAVSFALLAPDGTGVAYLAYAGETAQSAKCFTKFIDNGSAFDGVYSDAGGIGGIGYAAGLWFSAQDSFKGSLSYQIDVADQAPATFTVAQNTPNPFNPTTTINFALAKAGHVTIDVYNTAGQKVDTIVNANMSAGGHSATWNASRFAAGVYFYTVKTGEFFKTMKMTLLK